MMSDRKWDLLTSGLPYRFDPRLYTVRADFDPRKAPIIGLPLHDRIIGAMEGSDDGHTYFFTSR